MVLRCCICNHALEEPDQTSCGQRMCCKCFQDLLKKCSGKLRMTVECLSCREIIDAEQVLEGCICGGRVRGAGSLLYIQVSRLSMDWTEIQTAGSNIYDVEFFVINIL
eukprot:m.192609 g.192609  ORF g.192609 m.192609 type:complete len:108 (+) comp39474_c0_seq32:4193-4516(+)